jgi:hypothetical protein
MANIYLIFIHGAHNSYSPNKLKKLKKDIFLNKNSTPLRNKNSKKGHKIPNFETLVCAWTQ